MANIEKMIEELKQKRDELAVQVKLGSMEAKQEWDELEKKMDHFADEAKKFADDAKLKETGSGLGDALSNLGHEIKLGYERIRDALKD